MGEVRQVDEPELMEFYGAECDHCKQVSTYQTAFNTRPWLFWWPGLFIVTIALCINFIGDGLRDAFDPKQTRVRQ